MSLELRYRFWSWVHRNLERAWHWSWNAHLKSLSERTGRLPLPLVAEPWSSRYNVVYTYRSPDGETLVQDVEP